MGLTPDQKAYRTAVVAATAAEEALALTRTKSAAAGGLSVTGTAGVAGVGLGGQIVGGLTTLGSTITGALFSLPGAIALAVTGAVAGTAMVVSPELREAASERFRKTGWFDPDAIGGRVFGDKGSTGNWGKLPALKRPGKRGGDREAWRKSEEGVERMTGARAGMLSRVQWGRKEAEFESGIRARLAALERGKRDRALQRDVDTLGLSESESAVTLARRRDIASRGDTDQAAARLQTAQSQAETLRIRGPKGDIARYSEEMERARVEIEAAQAAMDAATSRGIQAAQDRLRAEKAISRERLQAADESIAKARAEIDLRKEAIDRERQRLMTAEERFGQLTGEEQKRLVGLASRAKRGEDLSVEEWQSLQGVGTRRMTQMAGEAFRARAQTAGFGRAFGEEERKRIAQYQKQRVELEVELKDQRDLKVQIEQDTQSLAERLGKFIAEEMDRREAQLLEQVRREALKQRRDYARQRNMADAQARQSLNVS